MYHCVDSLQQACETDELIGSYARVLGISE